MVGRKLPGAERPIDNRPQVDNLPHIKSGPGGHYFYILNGIVKKRVEVRILCVLAMATAAVRAQTPAPAPPPQTTDTGRAVSWTGIIPNVFQDQKTVWLGPVRAVRRHHWKPLLAVVAVTATLMATDAHSAGYFRDTNTFHGFNRAVTSNATSVGLVAIPASLYILGVATKDKYERHTVLLAGEAVLDAEILTTVMKAVDRRKRPSEYSPGGTLGDNWFEGTSPAYKARGSFPSGHAIAAFSVATVFARRYPQKKWVPYVAYGLATFVGFSRLTLSAHYPSDVFMGAALGYSISRFAVLHQ
jgi:membrane-associated phospholipid phosphatase